MVSVWIKPGKSSIFISTHESQCESEGRDRLSTMAEVTLILPDDLAKRIEPLRYLPTILEMSLLTLKTPAAQTASEIIEFLRENPEPQTVLDYFGTPRAQERMDYLQELNRSSAISEIELKELDDLLILGHIVIELKINLKQKEMPV
jgi:hypothetical protein